MKILDAKLILDHGYTTLSLVIDGIQADIFEPKQTLLQAGIVVLLNDDSYWEKSISATYHVDGRDVLIPGGCTEPAVVALAREFDKYLNSKNPTFCSEPAKAAGESREARR